MGSPVRRSVIAAAAALLLLAAGAYAQDKCAKCNIPVASGGCKCNNNCDCVSGTNSGGGSGDECAKCNIPVGNGGCKCNSNCDCVNGGNPTNPVNPVNKCTKCNVPIASGGCKCDSNCDCVGSQVIVNPPAGGAGCPAGWSPAVGTVYDSWPKPGTEECVQYSGCRWAGMFKNIDGGWAPNNCRNGAQYMNGGNGDMNCRFPESLVRSWNMAATHEMDASLLNRRLQVMVQGAPSRTVTVTVRDVCSDSDCAGCCSRNTGNRRYKLIDLEKWPASALLGWNPTSPTFDVNRQRIPTSYNMRPGAPEGSVMPLCYRVV